MARIFKFDADRLRTMVKGGSTATDICRAFDIKKTSLNSFILKLMKIDKSYYDIPGMNVRIITHKVTKLGFRISLPKMENYGFKVGEEVSIQKQDDGSLLIKKK